MALDPSLFVVFTCAKYVAVVHSFIHSFLYLFIYLFIYSVIVVQLSTDNDSFRRSEVEVE